MNHESENPVDFFWGPTKVSGCLFEDVNEHKWGKIQSSTNV